MSLIIIFLAIYQINHKQMKEAKNKQDLNIQLKVEINKNFILENECTEMFT